MSCGRTVGRGTKAARVDDADSCSVASLMRHPAALGRSGYGWFFTRSRTIYAPGRNVRAPSSTAVSCCA